MSPTRPEREEDCDHAPAPSARQPVLRVTAVSGPAEVEARIELHLSRCRRRGGELALLAVSVDAVSRGGRPGDAAAEQRVRTEVANRIGNAVRGSDAILRESERDTFVIMPGADGAVGERVRKRLERLLGGDYRVAGDLLTATVRVGAAAHSTHGGRAPDLIRRAAGR